MDGMHGQRVHDCQLFGSVLINAVSASLSDKDGDGHIEPKEIRTVMRNIGVRMDENAIKALIASVDADGNGKVCNLRLSGGQKSRLQRLAYERRGVYDDACVPWRSLFMRRMQVEFDEFVSIMASNMFRGMPRKRCAMIVLGAAVFL